MNVNGDIEGNDTKKRPTTVIQKLNELQISDSEPEVKKRKEMSSENIRRGAHDDSVDEIPSHVCGQGDIGQGEILFDDILLPEEHCVSGLKVALKPYTTNCGHTYCGEQIEILKRMNVQTFKCVGKDEDSPNNLCQEVVIVDNLKLDRALERNINRKVVRCSKFNDGCNETVQLRRLKHHLESDCQFANVSCPNCNRDVPRRELDQHLRDCRSKACGFSSIGCQHVSEPDDTASTSSFSTPSHSTGVHFSLMYQGLASIRSASEFSASTLNSAMTRHSQSVTCQEQALHMLAHPDEQKADEMNIQELDSQYKVKREEAQNTLDSYNRCVHMEYPSTIAEPVQMLRKRGQWLEAQEEEVNESMAKFMRETNEAPILLNQGSMIFKLTKFSEKRMKAIKGELKRGVYGPLFYTHEFGYLMVPIVYPNGDGGGTGTHLSFFIAIKKGKLDPLLRWPVVGCVTVSILSHLRVGRETVRHSFKTDVASLSYHRISDNYWIVGRVPISILSQRRVGRETVRHSFKTDVASLSYHRPTTDMNQASGVVPGDLNWIFHPSLHGIRSAVPSPPSYLTDVMCYIVTGLTDVHCPFSKSHLQKLVAKTPRKFLTKVRDRRLSEEKRSWLMHQKPLRRKTFLVNWPHNGSLSAKRMSEAGFYHSGGFDRVRCVYCGIRISHWKVGADPLREHATSFPLCWFVQFFHKSNTESAIDHPTNELQAPDQESHAPGAP